MRLKILRIFFLVYSQTVEKTHEYMEISFSLNKKSEIKSV